MGKYRILFTHRRPMPFSRRLLVFLTPLPISETESKILLGICVSQLRSGRVITLQSKINIVLQFIRPDDNLPLP
jgi:hypothetical protein